MSTPCGNAVQQLASHSLRHTSQMLDPRLKVLAERINALVEMSPYTKAEIARLVGLDRSAISKWVTGERTPTLKNLMDLAAVLQVEMTDLWEGPEAVPATPEQRAMIERMAHMDEAQQQAFLALAESFMKAKP